LDFILEDKRFLADQKSDANHLMDEICTLVRDMKASIQEKSYDSLDAERAVENGVPLGRSIFDDVYE
jgi:hypothetical protein